MAFASDAAGSLGLRSGSPRDRVDRRRVTQRKQGPDYDHFARAIRIKLIKEINNTPISDRRSRPPVYARRSAGRNASEDPG